MKVACIIPARGGSKGLPNKNRLLLNGLPLIARSILHARLSKNVSRVFVSTDDDRIAKIAIRFGADVVKRPPRLSGDTSSSESAIEHAVLQIKNNFNYVPDVVLFLQCTSPIRTHLEIDGAFNHFLAGKYDSLFSAVPSHKFFWKKSKNKNVSINYDYRTRPRRQDRVEEFIENGSIYIFYVRSFEEFKNRLSGKVGLYVMNYFSCFEIDDMNDFMICSSILSNIRPYVKYEKYLFKKSFSSKIKLLVLDFDGVLTDNLVMTNQLGVESVTCSRSDGYGISRIKSLGVSVIVISKEKNEVVLKRCKKLKIQAYNAIDHKLFFLKRYLKRHGISPNSVAYMGNDLNDLECIRYSKFSAAPCDAELEVLSNVMWVSKNKGGHGAVREFCDYLINNNYI